MRPVDWFAFAYGYIVVGVLVSMLVSGVDCLWDEDRSPWLYVGMAAFWPLVAVAVLAKAAKAVWAWGFGKGGAQ